MAEKLLSFQIDFHALELPMKVQSIRCRRGGREVSRRLLKAWTCEERLLSPKEVVTSVLTTAPALRALLAKLRPNTVLTLCHSVPIATL